LGNIYHGDDVNSQLKEFLLYIYITVCKHIQPGIPKATNTSELIKKHG